MNEWYLKHKIEVLSHYSPELKCMRCGCNDIRCLTIDHMNGNGNDHRRINGNTLIWLKKNNYPRGFQVLCMNCNWKKEIVKNYKKKISKYLIKHELNEKQTRNKQCNKCKRELPIQLFRITKKIPYHKYKRHHYCKDCENDKSYRQKLRYKIISHYSPEIKCVRCGCDDYDMLSIDHINGNGHIHRSEVTNRNIYKDIIENNFPEGEYQILCMNCQLIKSDENGEHKRNHNHL